MIRLGMKWHTSTLVVYAWGLLGITGEGRGWSRVAAQAERLIISVSFVLRLAQLFESHLPSVVSSNLGVIWMISAVLILAADMLKVYNRSSMSAKSGQPFIHLTANCLPHESNGQNANADNRIHSVKSTEKRRRVIRLGMKWHTSALFPTV